MKIFLLIIIGFISQFANAGKQRKHLSNGYTQEQFYKFENNTCTLVTDTYRQTPDLIDQKPIVGDVVDTAECLASFQMIEGNCIAFDKFENQISSVSKNLCSPSQQIKNGWYIIGENLKGSLQLTIPNGQHLFQGGKEPTLEVTTVSEVNCKITLFKKDSADRTLKPRILRLSDIQVQIIESTAYFSFNSFSEMSVDGQHLEPVKNVTCGVRDGFSLTDGSKFDIKQAKSFSINSIFEISKSIRFPVSKKPPTDI